ncbi:F-box domain containing protein [Cordyceps fumosorosea ARSEF 2679]|uniref:F-box domain containing protein n=1 Tax=Cordyceps fumosorosea (strain ARSEF 2679) TaxID=1081104 RepID=A0A167MJZ8_CORFA|nr:F-box domain containing protein [Cordyceps fumosorosea ARSEF 2679]OAA54449.1 F-box domain containing protein [Cordyceps fumosorosea ARSEF 2679]
MRNGPRGQATHSWDELPDEILLQIIAYLEPYHITRLQLVSRKLQELCLDDELWKQHCFDDSPWYLQLLSRRGSAPTFFGLATDGYGVQDGAHDVQDVVSPTESPDRVVLPPVPTTVDSKHRRWQRIQDLANWDPSFPTERVSWCDEYIQRYAPACISWLQTPRMRDRGMEAIIESRGVALYHPHDGNDGDGTMLAVSPLDDGSVCLWDIKGTRGKQGSIIGRSKPDILFIDGPSGQNQRRSKRIDTGVTECVSVGHRNNRAFFAVQSHLIEVDLHCLEVVSRQSFEWSITTMSAANEGLPLTVGTSLGIHLHDSRARSMIASDSSERIEWNGSDVYKSIFDPRPLPPYASLSQPTPISILHLPKPGSHSQISDDIYVSGRFTNILHYDRRKFPAIVGSIYSGGLIKSLAAVPYPYSTVDYEVRRQGEFPVEQISRIKRTNGGVTMVAGGAYKLKGSLEMYGLSSAVHSNERATLQNASMKNRQTAASSTILSLTTHGTRIAFSDGSGLIKWFERDGVTECRRHKIGSCDAKENNLFASSERGEIARKIVSTKSCAGQDGLNNKNNNILFWTGERLGMLSFTTAPMYQSEDFEEKNEEAAVEDEKRQRYADKMREALERQTDEIRLMSRFGHGPA